MRTTEQGIFGVAGLFVALGLIAGAVTSSAGVAACFIAVGTAVVVGYQSILTRMAVEVSQAEVDAMVKPVLVGGVGTEREFNASGGFVDVEWSARADQTGSEPYRFTILVKNVGTGPAFVTRSWSEDEQEAARLRSVPVGPGDTVSLDYDVPLHIVVDAAKAKRALKCHIEYTDLANHAQPATVLRMEPAKAPRWTITEVLRERI